MNRKMQAIILAIGLSASAASATGALAATPFQGDHPRRAEVNHRVVNQIQRIEVARHEGLISKRKAMLLRLEERRVLRRERFDARHHGGHITKVEQHRLNRTETRIGHRIG